MKVMLLQLTVAPSFKGGFVLTLVENKGREAKTYSLKYEETKLPSHAVEVTASVGQEFSLSEEIRVSREEAEGILQILKEVSISVMPAYVLGLDGTMYELYVGCGLNEARFQWWEEIPEGWESLGKVSNALLKLAGKPETSV